MMTKQNMPDDEICFSIKEREAWYKKGWVSLLLEKNTIWTYYVGDDIECLQEIRVISRLPNKLL
jgi:hypothetical protein